MIGLDEKALVVRRHDREPQTVSREAITHLEVSTGRRRQVLRGMLIGTGIGVLGMGVICSGRYDECAEASPVAMAGALLGTGIGALVKSDRWTAVPLDRVRVTLTPARRGVCLAVSIGF